LIRYRSADVTATDTDLKASSASASD